MKHREGKFVQSNLHKTGILLNFGSRRYICTSNLWFIGLFFCAAALDFTQPRKERRGDCGVLDDGIRLPVRRRRGSSRQGHAFWGAKMVRRLDDIGYLDANMFDAALGEVEFEHVLKKIIEHFGAGGGVIFELNRKTGEISNWIGPGLEGGAQDYIEHLNAINPRMRYSLRHAPGHVMYEGVFTNDHAMDRNEFYDAIHRLSGFRYFLGSRLYDEGDVSVFHSVEFTPKHGHPEKDKINTFVRTSSNLGKAWKLAKTQAADEANDGDQFVFRHLPWAIFAVDENGRVTPQNGPGQDFVYRGPMSLVDGRLISGSTDLNNAISVFLKRAISGQSGSMPLPLGDESLPLIMQSLPVPDRRTAFLFIRDARQSTGFFSKVLPGLFGLTAAEIRIVNVLAEGRDLQSVADNLQLSRNTVRNHLQAIYGKTGTSNRVELLTQLMGLIDNA